MKRGEQLEFTDLPYRYATRFAKRRAGEYPARSASGRSKPVAQNPHLHIPCSPCGVSHSTKKSYHFFLPFFSFPDSSAYGASDVYMQRAFVPAALRMKLGPKRG